MIDSDDGLSSDGTRFVSETIVFAVASGLSFFFALVRTKVQAVSWGPDGVGAVGLMQASMGVATLVVGFGVDGLITKDLAATSHPEARIRSISAAIRGMLVVALCGAGVAWMVFAVFADRLGFSSYADAGIVAIGTSAAVYVANQRAVISGTRLVRALAIAMVLGSLASAVIVGLLSLGTSSPLMWALAVLAVPMAQLVTFVLPVHRASAAPLASWLAATKEAARYMGRARLLAFTGLLPVLAQLLVRTQAHAALLPASFGAFQASMALAATSISVLASSVAPSVLPRLSQTATDQRRFSDTINETIATYLLLYAPVALMIEAMPDIIVRVLYTGEFLQASGQLSWQIVGEVLRLPCWVLATALTARGRFRAFFLAELGSLVASVVLIRITTAAGDLRYVGIGTSAATALQFVLLWIATGMDGVRLKSSLIVRLLILLTATATAAAVGPGHLAARVLVLTVAAFALVNAARRLALFRRR